MAPPNLHGDRNGNVEGGANDHQAILPGRAGPNATDAYENHRAGSAFLLHLGGCGLRYEQDGRPQDGPIWPSQERSAGEKLSDRTIDRPARYQQHGACDFRPAWRTVHECRDPWLRDFDRNGHLGAGIFARRLGRRILVSRIRAIHTDDWRGILAVRILVVGSIRAGSRHQWRRNHFGRSVGGVVWFVVVLVSPPDRKFMVCGRLSPGI